MLTFDEFTEEVNTAFVGEGQWYAKRIHQDLHLGLAWRAFADDPTRFAQVSADNPLADPFLGVVTTKGEWWLPPTVGVHSPRLVYPLLDSVLPRRTLIAAGTPIEQGAKVSWRVGLAVNGGLHREDKTLATSNSFYGLVMLERWLSHHLQVNWRVSGFLANMSADERGEALLPGGFPTIELHATYSPRIELAMSHNRDQSAQWFVMIDDLVYHIGTTPQSDVSAGHDLAKSFLSDVDFGDSATVDHHLHLGETVPAYRYVSHKFREAHWQSASYVVPPIHSAMLERSGAMLAD